MIIIIITIVEMLIPAHHQRLAIMSANPTRLGRAPTVAALAQLSRRARTSSLRPAVASTNSIGRSSTLWARCSPIAQSQLLNRSHSTSAPAATSALPEFSAEDTYDVVIIGAGNAGLALAASLISQPTLSKRLSRILLVEGGSLDRVRQWSPAPGLEWDNRVSSLTAENVAWLDQEVGAWRHVRQERSRAVHDMLVWTQTDGPATASQLHFPAASYLQPMARLTENINVQQALLKRIEGSQVEISEGSRVQEMVMGQGGRWVGLRLGDEDTPRWIRGSVVVGADGFQSPVRKFAEIDSFGHAYPTHAIVATLNHEPHAAHTAFQRFLPNGPIAFLPLDEQHTTLVWSTKPELAAAFKKLGPEALRHLVNLAFAADEASLGRIEEMVLTGELAASARTTDLLAAESRHVLRSLRPEDIKQLPPLVDGVEARSIASFPLKLSHAESYIGQRAVLVGDAAHTVHPLAGQGLNMGLADVRALCRVWEGVALSGGDLGSYTAMLPYATERYPANHALLSATDKMHYLFGTRLPVISWARSLGMDVLNELGPVKSMLMSRAGADPKQGNGPGAAERAADGLEGWRQTKALASMALAGGRELVKNGARGLLERIAK